MSLAVALKNTKPGLDGAGGRYLPASTSRAPAGSGVAENSAPSAVPTTSSLLWLTTAIGAGGWAVAALSTGTAWGAEQRVAQEAIGSRRVGRRSVEKTEEEEEAMSARGPRVRARGRVGTATLIQTGVIFGLVDALAFLASMWRACVRVRVRERWRGCG